MYLIHCGHQASTNKKNVLLKYWVSYCRLSRPPQAGSKFVATRKYRNRTDTSYSIPYIWLSSGDWLLGVVKGGGISSPSFLGGFRGWGLRLEVWTPLKEDVWIWLASRWGEIAVRILHGGYADAQGYVEKVNLVWRWVILNSLFRFCIWYTGHLPSLIYDALKSWCRGRTRRQASSFTYVGLVSVCSVVSSQVYVFCSERLWCKSF
jgi:hypothetical protein